MSLYGVICQHTGQIFLKTSAQMFWTLPRRLSRRRGVGIFRSRFGERCMFGHKANVSMWKRILANGVVHRFFWSWIIGLLLGKAESTGSIRLFSVAGITMAFGLRRIMGPNG